MKNHWLKKGLALLLALVMITATLAGCGGGGDADEGGSEGEANTNTDQTSFTIMGAQSAMSPGYDDNEVLNKMMEDTGISITWDTMSESLGEKVSIAIGGGGDDMPDAFMGVGFSNFDLMRYGDDGSFIDLTPYLTEEYMPNLAKILEEHPDIKAAITMADGKIYGLPAAEQMGTAGIGAAEDYSIYTVPQFSMINKAWLDDLGLEVPTNLTELHDVLVAFKENDMAHKYYGAAAGSTIPMSFRFDQWCQGQNVFYAGFGFTNWPNDVINDLVLDSDGKVSFVCAEQKYRDAINYFHDWYADGLIDLEVFSQDDTQLMSKTQQGWVGVATWWYIEELMGPYSEDYVFLPILDGPVGTPYEGTHNVTVRTGGATNAGQLTISSACKSPVNLLKFFDQWYTGESVMQLQYGPIGVYYTGQDDSGKWISITEQESHEKYNKGAGELKMTYEVAGPKLILSSYYNDVFYMEDRAIERLEDLYNFWMPYVDSTVTYPVDCVYTQEELDDIDLYKTDFQNAVAEQEGLWFRDGGITDDAWNAYVDHIMNTCGGNALLEIYQAAYDRYAEARG